MIGAGWQKNNTLLSQDVRAFFFFLWLTHKPDRRQQNTAKNHDDDDDDVVVCVRLYGTYYRPRSRYLPVKFLCKIRSPLSLKLRLTPATHFRR